MNELELIRELTSLESEKETLEIKINLWVDNTKNAEFKRRLIKVKYKINQIKQQLAMVKNKTASEEAGNLIIDQLNAYINIR